MITFKLKKIANHWYPCLNHNGGYLDGFEEKIDKYLDRIDHLKHEELTVVLDEVGVIWEGLDIIYFNESDIVRYLTTDDDFDLRFIVNQHEFKISSSIYWLLEDQFNCNFHKESYEIHIY